MGKVLKVKSRTLTEIGNQYKLGFSDTKTVLKHNLKYVLLVYD